MIEGHIADKDRIGYKMAQILQVSNGYKLVAIVPVGKAIDSVIETKKLLF